MKLPEDVRKKEAAAFSLGKFQNDFMSQGYPPLAFVRRTLLGENSPSEAYVMVGKNAELIGQRFRRRARVSVQHEAQQEENSRYLWYANYDEEPEVSALLPL